MSQGSDHHTVLACPRCGRSLDAARGCRHCSATLVGDTDRTMLQGGTASFTDTHSTDELLLAGEGGGHAYRFGDEIARGGMGRVVLAQDQGLRRDVACKLLLRPDDPQRRLRFLAEAQITGQLEHPNIVPIHGLALDEDGRPFFAMRLVRGDTLEQILDHLRAGERDRRWELNRLLEHFIGVCNGIGFAHSHGVIHRDLKPGNVMTGEYGQVLVMDWGLAKVLDRKRAAGSDSVRACAVTPDDARIRSIREEPLGGGSHTLEGEIMGTAAYMPPEQAAGRIDDLDERCDIYALGAILYEILCLQPPVRGENLREVLDRVVAGDIPPPETVAPERTIPRELSAIALKALARDREERYASVRDLRSDIRAFLDHRPVSASGDRSWDVVRKLIRRNPAASAVTLVAILVLTAIAGVGYGINHAARRDAEAAQQRAEAHLADFRAEQLARERADAERIALLEAQTAERERSWRLVFEHDFGQQAIDSEHWQASSGWHDVGPVALDDLGAFATREPSGLRVHGARNLHLGLRADLGLELRAELAATYHGGIDGGMHLCIGGATWRRGYIAQIGGWRNSAVAIQRGDGNANAPATLQRTPFRLEAGHRYEIVFTSRRVEAGMHLRLEIDSEILLEVVDPDPLTDTGGPDDAFALWTANLPDTTWHHLTLYRLGEPLRVDLLATAHRHLDLGNFGTAADLFAEVHAVADNPSRRAEAEAGLARTARRRDLHAGLDGWRERLTAAWPEALIECYVGERGYHLALTGPQVEDLDQVAGMPLEELFLRYTRVSSLEALRGQELRRFEAFNSPGVTDLEPLRDMPIRHFKLVNQAGVDLGPLAGMPLQSVYLGDVEITSIAALRGSPITELTLGSPILDNLQPLADLPLEILRLVDVPVRDLGPLAGSRLSHLTVTNAPDLVDLSPLAGVPLHELVIHDCPRVEDIGILAGLPLRELMLSRTAVSDLGPLRNVGLTSLSCAGSPIEDLEALRGMPLLRLSCAETAVSDLSPVAGMELIAIDLHGTQVADLGALRGMPLRELYCADSAVTDLGPLAGAPLQTVDLRDCAISDLTPIATPTLRLLVLLGSEVRDLRPLAGIRLQGLVIDPDRIDEASRPILEALPPGTVAPSIEAFIQRMTVDKPWRAAFAEAESQRSDSEGGDTPR